MSRFKDPKLADLVLAILGALTMGATSPFALVLSLEWLFDPSRIGWPRRLDWIALVLSIPGTAFFVWLSIGLFDYAPGGASFALMLSSYWLAFAIWLLVRVRTRWREVQALRRSRKTSTGTGDASVN